jgi:LuxR family maltose regulon positive regulatory protein
MATSTDTTLSPAVAHIIERPRLTKLLDEFEGRLILLAAPAGYGKTTLAQQWSDKQPTPVSWYRATRASADVAALAVGLDSSLSGLSPTTGPDAARIEAIAAANPKAEPLARALLKRHRGLPPEALLVVDEWESASSDDTERLLSILVEQLPIRYLLTSRTRPPWFARRAVYGHAREVGADALTMTDAEAREVLSKTPATETAQTLVEHAEGWPAVIGLAALDPTSNVPKGMVLPQTLYDFVAGEIVDAAPPEVQAALLLVAAASIHQIEVARLVLGGEADALLREAGERGLIAVFPSEGRLSVHPLLRELVLARLQQQESSQRAEALDRLRTLLRHGRWEECVAAAETIADSPFAVETLRSATEELLRAGRMTTLASLLDIGRGSGCEDPYLDYVEGKIAFRAGELDRALALGQHAAAVMKGDEQADAHLLVAQVAYLADRYDLSKQHFEAARRSSRAAVRGVALWGLSNCATEEQAADAESFLAAFCAEVAPSPENRLRAATGTLRLGLLKGDLVKRIHDAEVAVPLLPRVSDPMALTGFLNAYGHMLTLAGDYAQAVDILNRETKTAEEFGLDFAIRYVLHLRAAALIGLRRFAPANRDLGALERRLQSVPDPFLEVSVLIQRARICLSTGNAGWAADTLHLEPDRRNGRATIGEYLATRAIALAASGKGQEAMVTASHAEQVSRSIEASALANIARAICTAETGERQKTHHYFSRALATEVADAVVIGLRASAALLRDVSAQRSWHRTVKAILVRSNDAALGARAGLPIPRAARRTEALSPRELEIHELIAQGLTNREIARLLFISESTTKVHVHHVLEKLGVRSRVEAARIWQPPTGEDSTTSRG